MVPLLENLQVVVVLDPSLGQSFPLMPAQGQDISRDKRHASFETSMGAVVRVFYQNPELDEEF